MRRIKQTHSRGTDSPAQQRSCNETYHSASLLTVTVCAKNRLLFLGDGNIEIDLTESKGNRDAERLVLE